jgi:hypothetical protein
MLSLLTLELEVSGCYYESKGREEVSGGFIYLFPLSLMGALQVSSHGSCHVMLESLFRNVRVHCRAIAMCAFMAVKCMHILRGMLSLDGSDWVGSWSFAAQLSKLQKLLPLASLFDRRHCNAEHIVCRYGVHHLCRIGLHIHP